MLSPNSKFFSIHAYNNYKSYQTLKFFFPKWKEVQYDSGKADVCRKPVLHLRKQLKVRGCVEFCQTLWWIQGSCTPTPPPDQCFSGSTGLFGCLSITSLPHWLFCLPDTICYICLCVSVCVCKLLLQSQTFLETCNTAHKSWAVTSSCLFDRPELEA